MNWRLFMWAAMHHPDFKQCQLYPPIWFRFRREPTHFAVTIEFRNPLKLYVPYGIWRDHQRAHLDPDRFDDLPF